MTKIEYITTILSSLVGIRPYASGLLYFVQNHSVSAETLETIRHFLATAITQTTNIQHQQALQQGLTMIQKIQQSEAEQQAFDTQELNKLEELLDTL